MNKSIEEQLKLAMKDVFNLSDENADNIIGKIVDDLEKGRLLANVRFLQYTQRIKEDAYTFRLLGFWFVLESLVAAKERNKLNKVQKLLRDNLCPEDKVSLLSGFTFSKEYEFRRGPVYPLRHIMYDDFYRDRHYKCKNYITEEPEYCSGSNVPICYCVDWLSKNQNKVDGYLDVLIKYLYEIRNAIVHESFAVLGLPDYSEEGTGGPFSSSLLGAYPVSKDKRYFRSYEANIEPNRFFDILKNAVKGYLLS